MKVKWFDCYCFFSTDVIFFDKAEDIKTRHSEKVILQRGTSRWTKNQASFYKVCLCLFFNLALLLRRPPNLGTFLSFAIFSRNWSSKYWNTTSGLGKRHERYDTFVMFFFTLMFPYFSICSLIAIICFQDRKAHKSEAKTRLLAIRRKIIYLQ